MKQLEFDKELINAYYRMYLNLRANLKFKDIFRHLNSKTKGAEFWLNEGNFHYWLFYFCEEAYWKMRIIDNILRGWEE